MAPFPKICLFVAFIASSTAIAGCRSTEPGVKLDAGPVGPDGSFNFPAPRADLVPRAGSENTFELATWNIENFPKRDITPSMVADIITSLDIDMVALQEVANIDAFNELVERLRGYEGVLSSHTYGNGSYQKVGYVYRSSLVQVDGAFLLFTDDGYEFPRPALKVDVRVDNGGDNAFDFTAITLHLKAGGGAEDQSRRAASVVILERYLRSAVDGAGNDNIVVLGDLNATFSRDANVFVPLNDSTRYTIRTRANDSNGEVTFVPSGVILDHQVTTSSFEAGHSGGDTIIPRLDQQINSYDSQVSDHLPVIMRIPL